MLFCFKRLTAFLSYNRSFKICSEVSDSILSLPTNPMMHAFEIYMQMDSCVSFPLYVPFFYACEPVWCFFYWVMKGLFLLDL